MSKIALFHSVLGVRSGVVDAADRLRSEGHDVEIVDQYDGLVFDDYETASAYAADVGYPVLMERARRLGMAARRTGTDPLHA